MKIKKIDAYQHVRNSDCIYRRVKGTAMFAWKDYRRSEAGILAELGEKFKPYTGK